MSTVTRREVLAGIGASIATPAFAASSKREVDMNLVLALDVSLSVTDPRWEVQKRGYAAAFASREVQLAMLSGPIGAIGLTVVLWSGYKHRFQVVPWTLIDSRDMAGIISHLFGKMDRTYSHDTCIGGALALGAKLLKNAPFQAPRSVIDISGDGDENSPYVRDDGPVSLTTTRDSVLRGNPSLTINGLVLLGADDVRVPDLYEYYKSEVIGGPGAFAITVEDPNRLDLFTRGIEKKLIMEIS